MVKSIIRSTRFTYIKDKRTFVGEASMMPQPMNQGFIIEIETSGQQIDFTFKRISRVDGEIQSWEFTSKDGYTAEVLND